MLQVVYENSLVQLKSRVFRKLRKTQHQNPEFGPKPGEIKKKNLQKSILAFNRGWNSEM